MSKPELGEKRDCPECGARFYDLNKEPAHCPKCDHEFVPEALLKPRKTRAEEEAPAPEATAEKPAQETSLQSADEEKKAAESKRRAALDEVDDDDDDNDEDDELADIEDIDVDIDDDDDDSLLDDDEDDDDMSSIVKTGGEDQD